MAYYKATIEILVDVGCEAEACDCISETMRPLLREFESNSSVIDWRYVDPARDPEPHDGSGFEYAANDRGRAS